MAATKRRSIRQAATRKRSIYRDPETDDDFEAASEDEFQPEPEASREPAPKKRRSNNTQRKLQTRSKTAKTQQTTLTRILKVSKTCKPRSTPAKEEIGGPSIAVIPKWIELPHEILKQIFIYASSPSHDYTRESSSNVTWLLRSARTCRAFAVPALEAYYNSPAMFNQEYPHAFLELLQLPKNERYIDYNVKVQSLYLDVRTLAYAAQYRPNFDLSKLIQELPQLQHMEILHPRYLPPFRPVKIQKWTFPPAQLIRVMEQRNIRLRTWRWSRDTIPVKSSLDLYGTLSKVHESTVFAYLKRLVVSGFSVEDSLEPTDPDGCSPADAAQLPGLAKSISKLPSLVDLTFISCDTIMEKFLQRLPNTLQRLELSNCLEITSDMLQDFFITSGSGIKDLVLNHNAALNLSFTRSLKKNCPRLEVLKVDLHYYSERFTVNDAEALYDELLPEADVPTWPSTLRHLEIVHAQKWTPVAAQNLFRSLLDSASELLQMRSMVLHAHISIPWRDRVEFRDQWIERLSRVYLRRSNAPSQYMGSIMQFRTWQKGNGNGRASCAANESVHEAGSELSDDEVHTRGKRFSHVEVPPYVVSGETDHYWDSDFLLTLEKPQPRRSQRVAETQVSNVRKTATPTSVSDSDSEEESGGEEDWRKTPEKFVQGLCDIVDIRIDNQRPRENQWTEGDFLDSEASGDEDWHEGADEEEDSYAW